MRSIMIFAAAAALAAAGIAGAQSLAPQAPSPGSMMGTPGGAMGSGTMDGMGSGMMGHMQGGLGMMGGMGPGMMGPAMCNAMAGHIEGRLAYLKAELKITDAQEPLWNAFAAAARANSTTMLARCTTMMSQPGARAASLPDRLDQHAQFMAEGLEALRAMSEALKPLYAALDDSQKQTVDQLFMGRMGMM